MNPRFKEILDRTPNEPGVYMMRNKKGRVVYVGKATNLKSRLRSYFTGSDPRPFARRLSRILGDTETIITRNEKEAVLLENRLIKAHQPRYNIKLRDDKNYLSLRLDTRAPWPRVEVVRRQRRDGALYFGPYHSAASVRQTLRVLNKHFMLRTCPDRVLNNRSRPCLQYQIKRCPAPCVLDVDPDSYEQSVKEAVLFLQGRTQELSDTLHERMQAASEAWDYEMAAHYRDQIRDVERSLIRQQIESVRAVDQDVIGLYREGDAVAIEVLVVRKGIIVGTRRFTFSGQEMPADELLSSFIVQFYTRGAEVPHEVLVPLEIESQAAVEEVLGECRQTKVRINRPRRGAGLALLDTAQRNAEQAFAEELGAAEQRHAALEKLRARLRLTHLPRRIECFDISNLGDTAIVGSMVVFHDGEPDKSFYRTFRVRTIAGQDDFAALEEVLSRRVRRSQEQGDPWPDLMVIDGGKGQLGRVCRALEDLGAHHLEVVSLAKSRLRPSRDDNEEGKRRTDERVFIPGIKDPIALRPNTAELHLMQRVRDEAHRFAITYHKKLRRKRAMGSALERIQGIGAARRKALLKRFGSVGRVKHATLEELQEVDGISAKLAARIRRGLGAD